MQHIWKNLGKGLSPYIDGRFTPTTAYQTLINPSTRNPLCELSNATLDQVDKAIVCANRAQYSWEQNPHYRRDCLFKLSNALERHTEDVAALESFQTGKPLNDAISEVQSVVECLRTFSGQTNIPGESFMDPSMHAYTIREAYGTVGLVTSFNYPLLLAGWKLAPALAAGNCAIVKPAPQTPLTTLALAGLATDILPPGVLQVLPGGADVACRLMEQVDKTSFTGSTLVGQAIQRESGNRLTPGVLECGGNNAVIVLKDADIEQAAYTISQGAFSNAGQNCCAVSRIYVHNDVYKTFLTHLKKETMKWKAITPFETVGPNLYPYGPLIDQIQYEHIYPHTQYPYKNWTSPLSQLDGFYVSPTVYTNVPDDSPHVAQEIFGPVVSVLEPFTTTDEAIHRANSSNYGLASAVFSKNHKEAHKVAARLKTGVVWINLYNIVPDFLPFGGRNMSGIGKELGRAGLDEFTFLKSVMVEL